MKKIYFILIFLLCFGFVNAQDGLSKEEQERRQKNIEAANPFKEFGYTPKIATLSKGKYLEVHDLDSIVKIGSFYYHVKKKEITGYLVTDTKYSEATLKPEIISRWLSPDPLAEEFPSWSPYNFVMNNPLRYTDPTGMAPEDWVLGKGGIYWDPNAVSKATTQAGDTYLGKTLTFTFNSYIDGSLWDGPGGSSPVGDKLTSTIKVTGNSNSDGQLTGITSTKQIKIGDTPLGTARDYFPGLGADQNKFTFSQSKNADGTLASYNLNFEQHASVSSVEQFGLNMMGYDIVNVAQKMNLSLSGNNLSISAGTDIFPSATLNVNGTQLFKYNQPSFQATHGKSVNFTDEYPTRSENVSRRPEPSFYTRFNN